MPQSAVDPAAADAQADTAPLKAGGVPSTLVQTATCASAPQLQRLASQQVPQQLLVSSQMIPTEATSIPMRTATKPPPPRAAASPVLPSTRLLHGQSDQQQTQLRQALPLLPQWYAEGCVQPGLRCSAPAGYGGYQVSALSQPETPPPQPLQGFEDGALVGATTPFLDKLLQDDVGLNLSPGNPLMSMPFQMPSPFRDPQQL